jgi:hypothetical protein
MTGRRTFVAGEILTASNVMSFLMNQVVAIFADATARNSAISSPIKGNVIYLQDVDRLEKWNGTAWVPITGGFTAQETITATNSSWPVPSLGSPIVRVTVVGGGGGGGGGTGSLPTAGGTTTFNAGGAGTITAAGGPRGSNLQGTAPSSTTGQPGTDGLASHNGGTGGFRFQSLSSADGYGGSTGGGGKITVAYLDLTGVSTVNVTIGAGGSGTTGGNADGGAGGRGEVIVEYVAA